MIEKFENSVPEKRIPQIKRKIREIGRRILSKEKHGAEEKIGGIPADFFYKKTPFEKTITTENGRQLKCIFNDREIKIFDNEDATYEFKAELDTNGELTFIITTVFKGQRHPDLYAAKLFAAAFKYFDNPPDKPVRTIGALWEKDFYDNVPSVNYIQYYKYLNELRKAPEEITEDDRKSAALSTWTAKQASKQGFTEVLVSEEKGRVDVYFKRP